MSYKHLGFSLSGEYATFTCPECGATESTRVTHPLAPEIISKRMCAKGWRAYPYADPRTRCPTCVAVKSVNDPDSELRKLNMKAAPAPLTIEAPKATTVVLEDRQPTSEQRLAIRNHLDKNFDDSVGAYLAGFSDQRIAELVGVPRIMVERIREVGYGPIRENPELVALRTEAVQLKADIAALTTSLTALNKRSLDLASKVEKLVAGVV